MSCIEAGYICVPKGDDNLIVFTVRENDAEGALFDISGASEIVFAVADEIGGTVRIVKKLSTGGVNISTNDYQFYLTVSSSDTSGLMKQTNYYECRVTSSDGKKKTVSYGVFKAVDTIIKDIP